MLVFPGTTEFELTGLTKDLHFLVLGCLESVCPA